MKVPSPNSHGLPMKCTVPTLGGEVSSQAFENGQDAHQIQSMLE